MKQAAKKLGWFVGLYLMGLAIISIVAFIIRSAIL